MAVQIKYSPNNHALDVHLPASKSESNRLLVLQFLNKLEANSFDAVCGLAQDDTKPFEIDNLSDAGDTQVLQYCLEQIEQRNPEETVKLDCRDGGTPLRFLLAVCAFLPGSFLLTGTPRLMQRPQQDLTHSLCRAGAKIQSMGESGCGPYLVEGGQLEGGLWEIDMGQSSQFASALMLVAPFMEETIAIKIVHREASWPYVEMTLQTLKNVGVQFEWIGEELHIHPGIHPPKKISVEADWSSAAFFYAAQAMRKQGSMFFPGLKLDSLQGDAFVERLFRYEGIQSEQEATGIRIHWNQPDWNQNSLSVNLQSYPDLAPALVVYYLSQGRSVDWSGLESLAKKESVRDKVLGEMVEHCGGSLEIEGSIWKQRGLYHTSSSILNTADDHRMVMAFALLALKEQSVFLDDAQAVKKSFPAFWEEIGKLGLQSINQ